MSKRQNILAAWQQIPVANRTVEVNTKTGFSLTAGSYSVRASSTQHGDATIPDPGTSTTAAISAVTLIRASAGHMGQAGGPTATNTSLVRIDFTNTTTLTFIRGTTSVGQVADFDVVELF